MDEKIEVKEKLEEVKPVAKAVAKPADQEKILLQTEVKELTRKSEELKKQLAGFEKNKVSAMAAMKEAEAAAREKNSEVIQKEKDLEAIQNDYNNIEDALKDKFKEERVKVQNLKEDALKEYEVAREKRDRAEAMLAKSVSRERENGIKYMELEKLKRNVKSNEGILAKIEEDKKALAESVASLTKDKDALESRLTQLKALEVKLEAEGAEILKREAKIDSIERSLQEKHQDVNIIIEKYKVAIKEINDKEEKLQIFKGEVAEKELEILKRESAAESKLESAKQKEAEVKYQWSKIKKVLNDKKIEPFKED